MGILDELEVLRGARPDGNDQSSAVAELVEERRRDLGRAGGDDDGVVGSVREEALTTIPEEDGHVAVAEPGEDVSGMVDERGMALDGEDVIDEFGEQRALISGAGADFEDAVFGTEGERLEHECDDEGLGDGLALCDRERRIVVGLGAKLRSDELVAGHAQHGVEDALVANAAVAEEVDHRAAGFGKGVHGLRNMGF